MRVFYGIYVVKPSISFLLRPAEVIRTIRRVDSIVAAETPLLLLSRHSPKRSSPRDQPRLPLLLTK